MKEMIDARITALRREEQVLITKVNQLQAELVQASNSLVSVRGGVAELEALRNSLGTKTG